MSKYMRAKAIQERDGQILPDGAANIQIRLKPETIDWCKSLVQDNNGNAHSIILKCIRYSDGAEVIGLRGTDPLTGKEDEISVFTVEGPLVSDDVSIALLNAIRKELWKEAERLEAIRRMDEINEENRKLDYGRDKD